MARVDEVLAGLGARSSDEALRSDVEGIRSTLRSPLRIAVAGRVKAGKSTLVNALLGQRVAPTDVGECTTLVTWYAHDEAERLEIVHRDGTRTRRALRTDGSLPPDLGCDIAGVDHLEVFLSLDELRDVTIIDTPGLRSANDEHSERTRALLAIDEASRSGVAMADVLLLVMALEPHQQDLATLAEFDAQFGGLSRNALNAVGVLSRIDHAGVDPATAKAHGIELAERLSRHHQLSLAAVLPVNGLLAETTRCGQLTESDARALRSLVDLDAGRRRLLLLSADRFVESPSPVPASDRVRLLERLDLQGIGEALDILESGATSVGDLSRELHRRSGVEALAREVYENFAGRADAFKVGRALVALARLDPESDADRHLVRQVHEELSLDPRLAVVQLVRVAQLVASREVVLPEHLVADLGSIVDLHLELAAEGSVPCLDDGWLIAAIRRWRTFGNEGRAGPGERAAVDSVLRSLESLL